MIFKCNFSLNNNIHEKLCVWLAENECIFHVAQMQITNSLYYFVCLDFLWSFFM